jgi:hypothetical protein
VEAKRVRLLIDCLNIPIYAINYNFREFQGDYMNGIKRETQLRFSIQWYAKEIGFINKYRIAVFENNFQFNSKREENGITYFDCPLLLSNENITFEKRLAYYTNNVFGKKLTKVDMAKFKKLIGANDSTDFRRNMSIVKAVRDGTEDKCVCCCDKYDISKRTYLDPKTGRYYFEIHHMISVGKEKELDDVDNLAKLCPTCHAILGMNKELYEQDQKECIRNIFNHKPNILEFCESYFDTEDYDTVVDLVWKSLK